MSEFLSSQEYGTSSHDSKSNISMKNMNLILLKKKLGKNKHKEKVYEKFNFQNSK